MTFPEIALSDEDAKFVRGFREPKSLAALAFAACADARALDFSAYLPSWENWHNPIDDGDAVACEVCLAGAYLAKTLEIPIDVRVSSRGAVNSRPSWSWPCETRVSDVVHAIDALRTGEVNLALEYFRREKPETTDWHAACALTRSDEAKACAKTAEFNDETTFLEHVDRLEKLAEKIEEAGL